MGFAAILVMVRPVSSNTQNAILLAVLVYFAGLTLITSGWRLSPKITKAWLATLVAGLLGVSVGVIADTSGWLSEAAFFILFPSAFVVLIAAGGWKQLHNLMAAIPIGVFLASIASIAFFLTSTGGLPSSAGSLIEVGIRVNENGEFGKEVSTYAISTLAFGVPYLFALIGSGIKYKHWLANTLRWPAILTALAFLLISGRRGIILSVVIVCLAVALFMLARVDQTKATKILTALARGALLLVLLAVALRFSGFEVGNALASVEHAILGGDIRLNRQHPAFMASIGDSPIFGHGLGATLESFTANSTYPWRYELQYHLILNALGIVGAALLLVPTLYVLVAAFRYIRSNGPFSRPMIAILAGTVSILIANGSNPYLHTLGNMWAFFILVFAVDLTLRTRTDRDASAVSELDLRDMDNSR